MKLTITGEEEYDTLIKRFKQKDYTVLHEPGRYLRCSVNTNANTIMYLEIRHDNKTLGLYTTKDFTIKVEPSGYRFLLDKAFDKLESKLKSKI